MASRISRNGDDPSVVAIIGDDQQGPIYGDDTDTENAWSQWGEDLKTAQAKGIIRVARIPMNDDGSPNLTKKGQVQLMSVAHDQYNYDDLLDVIRNKFMKPGETMAVRLTGMRQSGTNAGVVPFNRIVMVSRSNEPLHGGAEERSTQLGEVLAAMQAQQTAQATMLREILAPKVAETHPPKRDILETIAVIGGIISPLLAPVLAAMIARPKEKSDMAGMIDALVKLKSITEGGGNASSDADDNSTLGIIKAVAPAGLQLLAALASKNTQQPVAQIPVAAGPKQLAAPRPLPSPKTVESAAPVQPLENVAAPTAVESPIMGEPAMLAALKPVLIQLVDMAQANAPAKDTAELLADMLPEEYDEQIFNLVQSPVAFARLKLLNADVGKHADWFEALRVEMLKLYDDPDAPAAGTGLADGGSENATLNG